MSFPILLLLVALANVHLTEFMFKPIYIGVINGQTHH
ncbi:hypothetical protein BCI9360_02248 [Bacillus sp. CECT 9360]|nr:hypothetical protein BCI9360_02248 [Bacillus sp. CECT 9360]